MVEASGIEASVVEASRRKSAFKFACKFTQLPAAFARVARNLVELGCKLFPSPYFNFFYFYVARRCLSVTAAILFISVCFFKV